MGADTEFPRRWNWRCVVEVMTGVNPRVGWNCWLGPSGIGCVEGRRHGFHFGWAGLEVLGLVANGQLNSGGERVMVCYLGN